MKITKWANKAWKRVLMAIMVVAMLCSTILKGTFGVSAATVRTQQEALAWINASVGQYRDYDGAYGAQCVDLIYYYYQYLGESPRGGNANAYISNSLPEGWTRIAYSSGFIAQPGDIAVWNSNVYSSVGHVALVSSASSSSMTVVEQNHDGSGTQGANKWTYSYTGNMNFWGVIRPAFSNTVALTTPTISFDKSSYTMGDTITVSWTPSPADSNLSHYWIVVYDPDGNECFGEKIDKSETSYSFATPGVGTYSVKLFATPTGSSSGEGSLTDKKSVVINAVPISYTSIAEDTYYLQNKYTGSYLHVANDADADATNIHLYSFGNYAGQQFAITATSTGYKMRPLCSSSRLVNPYADTVSAGKNVNLYHDTGDNSQWWKFQQASGGFVIRNVQNPGCVLDVLGGWDVYVNSYSGADSQIWTLQNRITYDANGGTGAPAAQLKDYGSTLTLSSVQPTRDGYTFLGWSTSSTATSATYQSGGSYTSNTNTTLYAVWAKKTYTVSYNANGGSGAPSNQTKTHGTTLTLSSTVPTRTGYTFLGWSTSSTATSATYQAGGSFTTDATTTLYAVWKLNTAVGDITADANVNMLDVMALFNITCGADTSDVSATVADVTGDGSINMLDVMALYNQISGK